MNANFSASGISNVTLGNNVSIKQRVNLYGCAIGNDGFIGRFVEIHDTCHIGHRVKIQSHSFVCSLVSIGDDCFISHGVMFVNDLFKTGKPAGGKVNLWKSTKIGCNVSIGTNSTILPVQICNNTVIGAGSVVTKDIPIPGIYAGNPAKLIRELK